jgi:hypothetical protein
MASTPATGFTPLAHADRFMERWDPQVYRR